MWNWQNRRKNEADLEAGVSEVRALLRENASERREPSPFFAKRVMAAIEGQENELVKRARAWAAVPAFASRLSAIAALLLLMAGTWFYSGNHGKQSVIANGIFEDSAAQAGSSSQDDVFTFPAEEAR